MADLRVVNLCLTDIPKEKIYKSEKSGKSYISLVIGDKDQKDQYDNDVSVTIAQTKEERQARTNKIYVGNGRKYKVTNTEAKKAASNKPEYEPFDQSDEKDDLPF